MFSNIITIIIFVLYLSFMLFLGLFFYKKTNNLSDYVLGGRGLGSWVTSLSAQASDMSGWLLMGLPGAAYFTGIDAAWIAIGLFIGTYLNWKFIAKRLRIYTQVSNDSLTMSDFLENRFKDKTKLLRIISSLFILFFFLIYTSAGLVSGAKLFNYVFNIPYVLALTIGAFVIVSYTFLGGFMAVCWTDFFQGLLMFIAIVLVPIAGLITLGGINNTVTEINNINPEILNVFTSFNNETNLYEPISFITIVSSLAWGLGYFGQPHILSRFMAINSPKEIKKARHIAIVWVFISLIAAISIGLIGKIYILNNNIVLPDKEKIFMAMIQSLFNPVVAGLFLAAILAAIMSTADSQLLVTSSALTQDIYYSFINKKASQKQLLWVSRISVMIVAIIAYIIALNPNNSVMDLVSYAWAGFGAAFGPIIILSLFWKRTNSYGALAGILSGGIMTIFWKSLSGGIFDLYELVPGFVFSFVIIIVVSLLTKKPSTEIIDEFNEFSSQC